jgi:hypothetical protein
VHRDHGARVAVEVVVASSSAVASGGGLARTGRRGPR